MTQEGLVGNLRETGIVLNAKINPETLEIICSTCNKSNFTIFRRDKVSQSIYLNHYKCENCGQLFIYNVDKKNEPILEKENGIRESRY